MKREISWKIVETVLLAVFMSFFAYFGIADGLYSGSIFILVLGIVIAIGVIVWIYVSVTDIREIQKMHPLRQKLEDYLKINSYNYIYFEYPNYESALPTNKDVDQWLIVYDPEPQIVGFKQAISPFPERYQFFFSTKDQRYLYIQDTYGRARKLLKK